MRKNCDVKRFPRDKKTGRLFDSIYDCANFYKISYQTIYNYCRSPQRSKAYNIDLEWVTIQQLSQEIRIMQDDIAYYKNAARFAEINIEKNAL